MLKRVDVAGVSGNTAGQTAVVWVVAGISLGYLIPMAVAVTRRHPQARAIGVLNIFLGWTVIGWAAALVWASTRVEEVHS